MIVKKCVHPELPPNIVPVQGGNGDMTTEVRREPVPPARFYARCEHNWSCPVCGFGAGQIPDPCDGEG